MYSAPIRANSTVYRPVQRDISVFPLVLMAYHSAQVHATTIETYYGPGPDTEALSDPDANRRNTGLEVNW